MRGWYLTMVVAMGIALSSTDANGVVLKQSIGLTEQPDTSTKICTLDLLPSWSSFEKTGLRKDDTIPDFTLYTPGGQAVTASAVLASGKPLLIISGSITCDVFRSHIADINSLYLKHSSEIAIYIIYVIEAHPIVDNSPYSGNVWVPQSNYDDSVLYRQPKSYGERAKLASTLVSRFTPLPPILIDGPCNAWWSTFGYAPNNAYLIDTLGRVYAKHGWFNNRIHNMEGDIDSLLKGVEPAFEDFTGSGSFTATLKTAKSEGMVNGTLVDSVVLANHSSTATTVTITRHQNALPSGWTTTMCTDICYGPSVSSIQQYLLPGDQVTFTLDFFTSSTPGTGTVVIDFVNADSSAQSMSFELSATAYAPVPLKPFIGLSSAPTINDRICTIPRALAPPDSVGPRIGDTIPDFTLYDTRGNATNASSILGRHKPLLLVAGSYSSPEFRAQLRELNGTFSLHERDVSIYIVYVVEPHPIVDKSPYTDSVWVPGQNFADDVLFRQPTTYGERIAVAENMIQLLNVHPPVLIDGPCNAWWLKFGPAPNNAYLIDTLGRVYAKHSWFNRAPREMDGDIDSLFKGVKPGYKVNGTTAETRHGTFAFAAQRDTARGFIDTVFTASAMLSNPTDYPVVVTMTRTLNLLPPNWASALGSDASWCPPNQSMSSQYIAPHGSKKFILDFSASNVPGTATVTIVFSNSDSAQNSVTRTFYGIATVPGAQLKSSIGLNSLPAASEAICSIAHVSDAPPSTGLHLGDTIPDFTLFTTAGVPVNASAVLAKKKPLLLVAGSISSPEFRATLPKLKALQLSRGNKVEMYIVYVVEPHPIVDVSPYSNTQWVTAQNYLDTALVRQPVTYGERSAAAASMISKIKLTVPVVLDGACNAWWSTFGPAPNNAYLISTDGRVYAKHAWFDESPRDMQADIDSLLRGVPFGYRTDGTHAGVHGTIAFSATRDSISGIAGTPLTARGTISNATIHPVVVAITRRGETLPPGWTSALGTSVLYNSSVDSTSVVLPGGASLPFSLEVTTTSMRGEGFVSVEFTNRDSAANSITRTFYFIATEPTSGVTDFDHARLDLSAFPQPVRRGGSLTINGSGVEMVRYELTDLLGRVIQSASVPHTGAVAIPTDGLRSGVYGYSIHTSAGAMKHGTFVVK